MKHSMVVFSLALFILTAFTCTSVQAQWRTIVGFGTGEYYPEGLGGGAYNGIGINTVIGYSKFDFSGL